MNLGVIGNFLQQLVGENEWDEKLHQSGAENEWNEKLHQPGGEMDFPAVFAFVPWRHHVEIITHCQSVEEATFYLGRTIREGWSRRALQNAIGRYLPSDEQIAQRLSMAERDFIAGR